MPQPGFESSAIDRAAPPGPDDATIHDPAMRQLYAMIDLFAPAPISVLVLGETGTGKDLYAAAIHARSARSAAPYLALCCTGLPEPILDAELFGHERETASGCVHAKPGLLESADGGTVVIDDIGDLPLATQAKLLRVLDSGTVIRNGSVRVRRIDVRLIATTHRNLRPLIAEGRFRADLFFRINGIAIRLPPLRDRRADIAPLARTFAARAAAALGRPAPVLTPDALDALERYAWPGNVRELKSVIDRAAVFCSGAVLGCSELELAEQRFAPPLPPRPGPASDSAELDELRTLGRHRILDALTQAAGNQTRAARALGISRFQLMRRLEAYGVPRPRKA